MGGGKPGPGSNQEPGRTARQVTYDVRIFDKIQVRDSAKGLRHRVRWTVNGIRQSATFPTAALAKNQLAKLRTAANEGEPFDVDSGLPVSMVPKDAIREDRGPTWYEFAISYAQMKWKLTAPGTRRTIAEALATASLALLGWEGRAPAREAVHAALSSWAFNLTARGNGCPEELEKTIAWVEDHSLDLAELSEPDVLRAVLQQLSQNLDGRKSAASTYARKRATLYNALGYAVEKGHFEVNPLLTISWTPPKNTEAIDRRRVVNEVKGRQLLVAVGHQSAMGQHLKAFFGCQLYAGFRPAEATSLTEDELELPEDAADEEAWGWFHLQDSSPQTGGSWTDSGEREIRQLKQRARKDTRPVPMSPPLVKLLHRHLATFGTAPDGRLFRAENGGLLSESTYTRVWEAARKEALTPAEVNSPLAERPYDLRHARLSIWLNAGINPAQVAEWAGNSVPVLLRVYAKCLTDSTDASLEKLGRRRPATNDDQAVDKPALEEDEEEPTIGEMTWYELATSYLAEKWDTVQPSTRSGIAETLTKVTITTLAHDGPWPTDVQLRTALTSWAFNRNRWDRIPDDQAEVIAWVENQSPPIESLWQTDGLATVLVDLGRRLNGQPASKAVAARRRSTLFNILEFAVRQRQLPSNPLLFRDWSMIADRFSPES